LAESNSSPNALVPLIIFVGILALTLVVPKFGLIASVILPTPIILVSLAYGRQAGLVLSVLVFAILLILVGPGEAIGFIGQFAILAIIMAESIKYGFSFDKCIAFSSIGAAVVALLIIYSFQGGGEKSATDYFQENINQTIEKLKVSVKEISSESGQDKSETEETIKLIESYSEKIVSVFPAYFSVGVLFTAILNFFVVMYIWPRFYGKRIFEVVEFSKWMLPDTFVGPLIFSGLLVFIGSGGIQIAGMNLLILTLTIYFLQGAVIAFDLLIGKNVSVVFSILIILILTIVTQFLFIGILIGMGIFDLWVDFRKIRVVPPASPQG
jgi:MFS family permease